MPEGDGIAVGVPHKPHRRPRLGAAHREEVAAGLEIVVARRGARLDVVVHAGICVYCLDAGLLDVAQVGRGRVCDGARIYDASAEVVFAVVDVFRDRKPAVEPFLPVCI